jgi:tetratricopeptide (TPR) repeat protein
MKNHEDAIKDIDLAIKLDKNNHLFYNGKGVSLIALEKYKEAENNFDACLKINPNFGQAYYNRGYVKQVGYGDKEAACRDWETAASKGYKGANVYLNQYCK